MKKKRYEDISLVEKVKHDCKIANRCSNIAIGISIIVILLNIIANLDEIVSLLHYVQSCLR